MLDSICSLSKQCLMSAHNGSLPSIQSDIISCGHIHKQNINLRFSMKVSKLEDYGLKVFGYRFVNRISFLRYNLL